jgi:rSAM/selenodomain-associated transferase 2
MIKISVIIPTYNEENTIVETLKALCAQNPDEILVVDGGSGDRTVALAAASARVVHSLKGRARQMNCGALEAQGDVLLFLHADTHLPPEGLDMIRDWIEKGKEAGRFRLRFDQKKWRLRLFASYTRFQCFSYGDQAFFVTRELFEKLGGYRENVPFEDVDFYTRLRQIRKPVIIRQPVVTSARRFLGVGCWRQKFINLFLVGLYAMGFPIAGLKKTLYPDIR